MSERKGSISVNTSDIFPIIKKWLYSEHDIFFRELIANATDAITKRATLSRTKNIQVDGPKIEVTVNKAQKTIEILDNGIGMTEAEVEKYIAQLAFSGAEEFVKKLEKSGDSSKQDIIGKFGLGFYSSFMVANKVQIDSLSMEDGAKATRWICEGDTEYFFSESDHHKIGTKITLHLNEDGEEFLDSYKVSQTLRKFCDFMPYAITVFDTERIENEKKENEKKKKEEEKSYYAIKGTVINETAPLWKKDPTTIEEKEYKEFFHKLYPMDPEPLFWIHLKVDHPFTLDGVLYFPKFNPNKPINESNIKLYCKQVFVSDNVKSIIPDFLSLLKGIVDSPDIPLNVSRSSLQGDPNIKKISNYIIKKVAESLKKLFNNDREKFEKIWEDIGLFVKYGAISDDKFDDLMRSMVIFKNHNDKFLTLEEYEKEIPEEYKKKLEDKIIYFEKGKSDTSLKNQLRSVQIPVILTDDHIDPHFMQHLETKVLPEKKKIQFCSIDSEIGKILETEKTTSEDVKIKDLFQEILSPESKTKEEQKEPNPFDSGLLVEIEKIKNATMPAYFKVDEQMKRYRNMAKSMGQENAFPIKKTLVINPSNPLIQKTLKIWEKGDQKDLVKKLCKHVEDLAVISSEGLKDDEKEKFVSRTQNLVEELSNFI